MAIKVSNINVIDDSRNLENINRINVSGSYGNAGQVLTSNGSTDNVYWSNVNVNGGSTKITNSTGVINLTASSNRIQEIDFTVAEGKVFLPDATTLLQTGGPLFILTAKNFGFDVFLNSGFAVSYVEPGENITFFLKNNTTTDGEWFTDRGDIWGAIGYGTTNTINLATDDEVLNNAGISAIDDNRSLLVYKSPANNRQLLGIVVTSTGANNTFGTPTLLASFGNYISSGPKLAKVSSNTWLVGHNVYTLGHWATGLQVSGTTIIASPTAQIAAAPSFTYPFYTIEKLTNNVAFALYSTSTSSTLSAKLVTHNGNLAPTFSSTFSLATDYGAWHKAINVGDGKICLALKLSETNPPVYLRSITGNSTSITVGPFVTTNVATQVQNYPFAPDCVTMIAANTLLIISTHTRTSLSNNTGQVLKMNYPVYGLFDVSGTNAVQLDYGVLPYNDDPGFFADEKTISYSCAGIPSKNAAVAFLFGGKGDSARASDPITSKLNTITDLNDKTSPTIYIKYNPVTKSITAKKLQARTMLNTDGFSPQYGVHSDIINNSLFVLTSNTNKYFITNDGTTVTEKMSVRKINII